MNNEKKEHSKYTVSPIYELNDDDEYIINPIYKADRMECPIYHLDGSSDEDLRRFPATDKKAKPEAMQVVHAREIIRDTSTPVNTGTNKMSMVNLSAGTEKPQPISNFCLTPIVMKKAMDHNMNMVVEKSTIDVLIEINTGVKITRDMFTVQWDKVGSLASIVSKRFPKAILYDRSLGGQIEMEFREKLANVRETVIFTEHGWHETGTGHLFVHKSAKNVPGEIMTDLDLPSDPTIPVSECFTIWTNSLGLYKVPGVMAALSMVSMMGVTFKLFDEAGFPIRFTTFLLGDTGSYKTSLAMVMFTQVEVKEHRKHPRRLDADTLVSLERGLVLNGRDNATIIDDFSPGTGAKRTKMDASLELVVRGTAEGSTRSRSSSKLDDKRGEGIKGVVVVTGEIRGGGMSSNLRCLYCSIKKKFVDKEVLSKFQNSALYETLLQHYINYLSANWGAVVGKIRGLFTNYRYEAGRYLNTGRQADDLVFLWIMADILYDFFTDYCKVDVRNELFVKLKREMIPVVQESERMAYEEDPAVTYMRALATMLENRELMIKPARLQEADLRVYDGFEEGEYLYLLTGHPYAKIRSWILMGGGSFAYDEKEITSIICRRGYAVPSSNGNNKTTLHARLLVRESTNKVNFVKLRKDAIKEFAISEPDFF